MTTKKYKTNPNKPSAIFVDSLYGGGSHFMVCGYCGREHYCPDSYVVLNDDDPDHPYENYLTDVLAAKEKDPDGIVIHYDDDYVRAKDLNGMAFVIDCPCNGLYIYEQFIWQDKDSIRNYLKNRIDLELKQAEEQKTINVLKGI